MTVDLNSLKEKAERYIQNEDYSLFRNCLYRLGEAAYEREDLRYALVYWMRCCYLDINGPNNTSGNLDNTLKLYREHKCWSAWENYYFNPEYHGNLAPNLIRILKYNFDNTEFTIEQYHDIFMENCLELLEDLNTPIAPTPAWKKLRDRLEEHV